MVNVMSNLLGTEDLLQIRGFRLCRMLDGSTFRAKVPMYAVLLEEGDQGEEVEDPRVAESTIETMGAVNFVHFIDRLATQIIRDIQRKREYDFERVRVGQPRRLACYMAAEGRNQYVRYAQRRLLHAIDPKVYFSGMGWTTPQLPAGIPTVNTMLGTTGRTQPEPRTTIDRQADWERASQLPHYRLAFTIIAHDNFLGLSKLIHQLHSPNTIIAIHVDGKNEGIHLFGLVRTHPHLSG